MCVEKLASRFTRLDFLTCFIREKRNIFILMRVNFLEQGTFSLYIAGQQILEIINLQPSPNFDISFKTNETLCKKLSSYYR